MGTPSDFPSVHLKSPTRNATRYVDIFGVVAKRSVVCRQQGREVRDDVCAEMAVSAVPTRVTS
jgi:hypothetical protein